MSIIKEPSDLRYFCYRLVRKYGSPDKASEEQKADAFRKYYLGNLPPSVQALRALASRSGLKLDISDKMPANLRGYNHVVNGTNNIVIKENDTVSGTQNTILHEIREIMERIFPTLCRTYTPLKTSARHYAANRFAAAVLLPSESFRTKVYETGFDVVDLASFYSKSCSQVLLRIGEVTQGMLFYYAGIYEPDPANTWRVTYWTGSSNHEDPEANIYGLNGLFPRKGREILHDSLVDLAVRTGRSHLAERITLLDDREDEGLVALANPLIIQDKPCKVILTVLLSQNRGLLAQQVERLNPVKVEGFHRHL
ncbi:MAG: ImmA/IrrE family metallo-endopeptidase [Dehalococcoidales bacterium]|nr:ImmA/IrrE family metallo-endopeptidase [Dehalococcoidales bacterium]